MDTDVLIVGAGPTGLMLANQLGRRGVRTLIIDRHAGPAQQTRALGVQARTLEIYAKLGIVDRALELGKRGTGANLWARRAQDGARSSRRSRSARHAAIRTSSSWARTTTSGSWATSSPTGGLPSNGTRSSSLSSRTRTGSTATLKLPDGATRTVTAAWVGGCDGARSAVRELERHRLSRRAVRARVLRRRHRGDGKHGRRTRSTSTCGGRDSTCTFRCAARITGGSSASCRRPCGTSPT